MLFFKDSRRVAVHSARRLPADANSAETNRANGDASASDAM